MINKYLKFMKKEKLHEVTQIEITTEDNHAAEYAAQFAVTCYNHLQLKTPNNYHEEEQNIICSPEVLAATIQIAYQERYKLRDRESILIRQLTNEEYNEIP